MTAVAHIDRRVGSAIRRGVSAAAHGPAIAEAFASALAPGFRLTVTLLIARRARRGSGLRALAAGGAAATLARILRDRLGRRRPGARPEGGFPSRHAAAATAIAASVVHREPGLGRVLVVATALGGVARVATAEHEPADIAAGVALGLLVAHSQQWAICRLRTARGPFT